MADRHTTIAAEALNFRVRDGNGCYLLAMVTGKNPIKIYNCRESRTKHTFAGKRKKMIKPHDRLVLVS